MKDGKPLQPAKPGSGGAKSLHPSSADQQGDDTNGFSSEATEDSSVEVEYIPTGDETLPWRSKLPEQSLPWRRSASRDRARDRSASKHRSVERPEPVPWTEQKVALKKTIQKAKEIPKEKIGGGEEVSLKPTKTEKREIPREQLEKVDLRRVSVDRAIQELREEEIVEHVKHEEDISIVEITKQMDELIRKDTERSKQFKETFVESDEASILRLKTSEDETILEKGVPWKRGPKTRDTSLDKRQDLEDTTILEVNQIEQTTATEKAVPWKRGPKTRDTSLDKRQVTEETTLLDVQKAEEISQKTTEEAVMWKRGPKAKIEQTNEETVEEKPEEKPVEQAVPWKRGPKGPRDTSVEKPIEEKKLEKEEPVPWTQQVSKLKPTVRQQKVVEKETIEQVELKRSKVVKQQTEKEQLEQVRLKPIPAVQSGVAEEIEDTQETIEIETAEQTKETKVKPTRVIKVKKAREEVVSVEDSNLLAVEKSVEESQTIDSEKTQEQPVMWQRGKKKIEKQLVQQTEDATLLEVAQKEEIEEETKEQAVMWKRGPKAKPESDVIPEQVEQKPIEEAAQESGVPWKRGPKKRDTSLDKKDEPVPWTEQVGKLKPTIKQKQPIQKEELEQVDLKAVKHTEPVQDSPIEEHETSIEDSKTPKKVTKVIKVKKQEQQKEQTQEDVSVQEAQVVEDSNLLEVTTETEEKSKQEQPVPWKRGPKDQKPEVLTTSQEEPVEVKPQDVSEKKVKKVIKVKKPKSVETSPEETEEVEEQTEILAQEPTQEEKPQDQQVPWKRGPKKPTEEAVIDKKPDEELSWIDRPTKLKPVIRQQKPIEREKIEEVELKPTKREKLPIDKTELEDVTLKPLDVKETQVVEEVKEEPVEEKPTAWRRGKKIKPVEKNLEELDIPDVPLEKRTKEVPETVPQKPEPQKEEAKPEEPQKAPWRRGKKEQPETEVPEEKQWPTGKRRPLPEEEKEQVTLKPIQKEKPVEKQIPEGKIKPKKKTTPEEIEEPTEEEKQWPTGKQHQIPEDEKVDISLKPIDKPVSEEKPSEEVKAPWKRGKKEKPEETSEEKTWPKGKRHPLPEEVPEEIKLKPIPKPKPEDEPRPEKELEIKPPKYEEKDISEEPEKIKPKITKKVRKPKEDKPEMPLEEAPETEVVVEEEVVTEEIPEEELPEEQHVTKVTKVKKLKKFKKVVEEQYPQVEEPEDEEAEEIPLARQESVTIEEVPLEETQPTKKKKRPVPLKLDLEEFKKPQERVFVTEEEVVQSEMTQGIVKKKKSKQKHVVIKEEFNTIEYKSPEEFSSEDISGEEEETLEAQTELELKQKEKPQPLATQPEEILEETPSMKQLKIETKSKVIKKTKRTIVHHDEDKPFPELEVISEKRIDENIEKVPEEETIDEETSEKQVKVVKRKVKKVQPQVMAPRFVEKLQPVLTETDQPIFLQCKVEGVPFPEIKWFFNDTELFATERYSMTVVENVAVLEIASAKPQDVGIYTCEARNEGGVATTRTNIIVQDVEEPGIAPSFITPLKITVPQDKDKAKVTCQVHGIPQPTVKWYKEDVELVNSEEILIDYDEQTGFTVLEVTNPEVNHPIVYTIEAENKFGRAIGRANVFIQSIEIVKDRPEKLKAPKIITPLRAQIIKNGTNLVFDCKYEGVPHPIVKWFKNGKEIKVEEDEEVTIVTEEYRSRLEVKNVTRKRSGKYEIVATNKAGEAKSSGSVVVSDTKDEQVKAPRFIKPLTPKIVAENEVAILEVTVDSYPTSSFQWFIGSNPIKSSNEVRIVTNENKSVLIIETFSKQHIGAYTCRAENVAGSVTSTATVEVLEDISMEEITEFTSPRFVEKIKPISVMDGEKLVLSCQVRAVPTPKVQWLHNELVINEAKHVQIEQDTTGLCTLIIPEVFPENAGEYTCIAENRLGKAICKTTVVINGKSSLCVEINIKLILFTAFEYIPDSEITSQTIEDDQIEDRTISIDDKTVAEFAPRIIKELPQIIKTQDKQLTKLEVKVVGQPKPQVKWLKAGEEIIASEDFQIFNFDDGTSVLIINDVYPDDSGEISFEAYNALGVAVTTTELCVEGKLMKYFNFFLFQKWQN